MIFQLHKLSSEPEAFAPVKFSEGVNLILGERSKNSKSKQAAKVNGVGKSVFVDFLHFALGRDAGKTRVMKIPDDVLPEDCVITLDLSIRGVRYQIKRSVAKPETPTLTKAGKRKPQTFQNLEDFNTYLGTLMFRGDQMAEQTSFRQVFSLLMRDEASGFRDFLNPMPAKTRATPPIAPHLYLMGIDGSVIHSYELLHKEIKNLTNSITQLKRVITDNDRVSLGDLPAKLNQQEKVVDRIQKALDQLKTDPAYEQSEQHLIEIEARLRKLRAERKSLAWQIQQIFVIPPSEHIDSSDIRIVYDKIKAGLGDFVVKSLEEAQTFKEELAVFQQSLINEERTRLEAEKANIQSQIRKFSSEHTNIVESLDGREILSELKNGLIAANEQSEDYQRLKAQFDTHKLLVQEKAEKKVDLEKRLNAVRSLIRDNEVTATTVEKRFVNIHEFIMHSGKASLRLVAAPRIANKSPLTIDARITADGSKSVDESKVFIYDFALLTAPLIDPRHPGFLLHDNILEVDNDTLVYSLNFLQNLEENGTDFQYILTLNEDKIEPKEIADKITLPIDAHVRARFSKAQKFLRKDYEEVQS